MLLSKEDLLLYAVTDRSWLRGQTLEQAVTACICGGATFLQLREKELPYEGFFTAGPGDKGIDRPPSNSFCR